MKNILVPIDGSHPSHNALQHAIDIANVYGAELTIVNITNADAGCGLIKYGSALVPFINQFPRDTKLYQLMTTRPGEGEFARGQD